MENEKLTGVQVMEDTIELARKIANLCVSSPLKSKNSCDNAMHIAAMLLDSNASEFSLR